MNHTINYLADDADTGTFEVEMFGEIDVPEALEHWELDDFSDVLAY